MSATLLSGSDLAKERRAALKEAVNNFRANHHVTPTLAILRVGDDEAAAGYARAIARNCKNSDVGFEATELPVNADQQQVGAALQQLNDDPAIHGIMILEPLPPQIDGTALLQQLNPAKDVDGVHPLNAGRLLAQRPPYFTPATPAAGLALLEEAGVDFKGQHAVIVGRSDIVGKPMALLLLHRHCTVTI
ncbi:MAG: bifunctional 5,10-methylenetetrahydrofolate dehydrogenase/5,10-methenyltetrahydrofolate cyclohydrolase, partial [Caldilineaceae bacterium]|nr:bifunctional 5,10-methylenetetrahydrofolate dehydrogenase/5,10-methenyltetrahydrofolate cyclohydrolase [Caldilineaceae bacterium]